MTPTPTSDKTIARLQHKVRVLEEMIEDRSRQAYREGERRSALNALLTLSLRAETKEDFLTGALEILLAQEVCAIEGCGGIILTDPGTGRLTVAAAQDLPEACLAKEDCFCRRAARSGVLLFSAAGAKEERQCCAAHDLQADVCAIPIRANGGLVGAICLFLPPQIQLGDQDVEFFLAAGDVVAGALRRFLYEEDLNRYQANLEAMVEEKIEELRRAEERYRDIVLHAQDGIFQTTMEGRFLTCNPALARIHGYRDAGELMAAVTDVGSQLYVNPQDRQRLIDAARQGPVRDFVTRLRRRDGGVIWAQISARLVAGGARPPYLEGYVRDITARHQAEEALAEERNRLAVTLASIGDGVITTDTEGRILLINPVAAGLTGWEPEEAVGQPLARVLRLVDGRNRSELPDPVAQVLAHGDTVTLRGDTLLLAQDGTERRVADSGAPIRDSDGRVIGVVLVFRDVTEQERLEQEARKNQRLESLGVLAGGIAHDFNNMLSAILGNISLAQRLLAGHDGQAVELLAEAKRASLRARDLVRQLQTFAKGGEPIRESAALDEVIRESAGFVLRGSNIACTYDFPADLWLADIDSGQISQVIQNLAINAMQAMAGGGTLTISCRNRRVAGGEEEGVAPGRYLEVRVADSGPGIDPGILGRIFDPYYTTKEQGSGLGLAIVHSVVRKHGGRVQVDSRPGEGAVFTILLPAAPESATSQVVAAGTLRGGHGRILVMDDDEAIRTLAVNMLRFLGYEAEAVADGAAAVAAWHEAAAAGRPFAAAIFDLTIPGGMGGKEAGLAILARDPAARIVIASGYERERVLANYRSLGFAGILVKPFRTGELDRVLAEVLG